jgi:peptide/nickel transport system substrate-binding protein
MGKRFRIFIVHLFLAVFALTSSCMWTAATKAIAQPRGEIRLVENWRPDITVLGHNVLQYLYEYALDRNELVPCLAVSRKWVDETTLELKLREEVRFHNGEPFDARAVKFNFEFQRKHNPGRGVQVYMNKVREIRIIDPHTVHMILDQPNSLVLFHMVGGPVGGFVIGAPKYLEQVGWNEFLRRPMGTGPYMVDGEVKNHRQVAEGEIYAKIVANPQYWNKSYPRIKTIKFVYHSSKEALNALVEGNVDLVTSIIPKDTLKVEESPYAKVLKGRNDVRFTAGFLNPLSPDNLPLRDLRVRKALNYAINKQELLRYAFKGNAIDMRGVLTEKSGVDLSGAESYEWNIKKARALLKEAGYEQGLKMKLFYQEKDYLIAYLLKRFYSFLKLEVEITSVDWEWIVRHVVYPNTRKGYSWDNEDWWITVWSQPGMVPEVMGGMLEWFFHCGAPWQLFPSWVMDPLDSMYHEVLRTRNRDKRLQIYKRANEYIADQALWFFTVAPLSLYGVNEELDFIPQMSQYLYLDYSSVTENHWSLRGKNN